MSGAIPTHPPGRRMLDLQKMNAKSIAPVLDDLRIELKLINSRLEKIEAMLKLRPINQQDQERKQKEFLEAAYFVYQKDPDNFPLKAWCLDVSLNYSLGNYPEGELLIYLKNRFAEDWKIRHKAYLEQRKK
jgi:hypothetical protein